MDVFDLGCIFVEPFVRLFSGFEIFPRGVIFQLSFDKLLNLLITCTYLFLKLLVVFILLSESKKEVLSVSFLSVLWQFLLLIFCSYYVGV